MVETDEFSRRRVIEVGGSLVIIGGLAGCIGAAQEPDDDDIEEDDEEEVEVDDEEEEVDDEEEEEEDAPEMAGVRAAHLSPDAPDVDIYVDGDPVLEDVSFGVVSDYLELEPGTYSVRIVPAGEEPEEAVIDEEVEVSEGYYTIAAIGEVSAENQPLQALVLEDDTSPLDDDTARVRVLHASPDAPAVDITVGGNGDILFENVGFCESGYVEVPEGDYLLCIYPTCQRDEAVLGIDVSVDGGTVYSAFAVGYVAPEDAPVDEPFDVILTEDAMPEAEDDDIVDDDPDDDEIVDDDPDDDPDDDDILDDDPDDDDPEDDDPDDDDILDDDPDDDDPDDDDPEDDDSDY